MPVARPFWRLVIAVVLVETVLAVVVARPTSAVRAPATVWLVADSWLPVTASVEPAASVPSSRPVRVRLPAVPARLTRVPSVAAPTVSSRLVGFC